MNVVTSIKMKINSSELLKRIMNAIVYGIGGSVGSRALMMFSGVVLSRVLGKEFYGQFSLLNSTVNLFVAFSGMGISATLTRYIALYRNDAYKLGNIIGTLSAFVAVLSVIMSFILLLFSEQLSLWVSGTNDLTTYFEVTCYTIFFSALASIQQSILLGMEKYKSSAKIELIRCGVYIVMATIFSAWKGIYGAIWAVLISYILQLCMMYMENLREYKAKNIKLNFKFDLDIRIIILKFTIPAFVSGLFVMPVNWINNSLLAKEVGFGEVAIFSVALQWMTMITYIPSQMGQVRPIYTDLYAQKKYIELRKLFKNITLSSTILVTPIVLLGIIFSKRILSLYGNGYDSGYLAFMLMMISALLITVQSQVGALLQSIGEMWAGFALNLIWSIVIIGVFYYFRDLGSVGYAISYCFAYGIHTVLSYVVVYFFWIKRGR